MQNQQVVVRNTVAQTMTDPGCFFRRKSGKMRKINRSNGLGIYLVYILAARASGADKREDRPVFNGFNKLFSVQGVSSFRDSQSSGVQADSSSASAESGRIAK